MAPHNVPLSVESVSFGYPGGAQVLQSFSASFEAGSMTALTGPSGRGKSTLLYLMGLMLKPSEGQILVAGLPASGLSDAARAAMRAEHFGFVFQDAALDGTRTVIDNITEAALYRKGGRRADDRVRAEVLLRDFGVEVPGRRRPGQVSGGQAQRIALCRALVHGPRVLLADEPTGNLDPMTTEVVVSALRAEAERGCAVVVVTHSPDVARACDKQLTL